jgi:hypothetical protein
MERKLVAPVFSLRCWHNRSDISRHRRACNECGVWSLDDRCDRQSSGQRRTHSEWRSSRVAFGDCWHCHGPVRLHIPRLLCVIPYYLSSKISLTFCLYSLCGIPETVGAAKAHLYRIGPRAGRSLLRSYWCRGDQYPRQQGHRGDQNRTWGKTRISDMDVIYHSICEESRYKP